MEEVKKISVRIVGMIWLLVGVGLSIAGVNWILSLGIGPKMIIFLTASCLIGLLKGRFVLQKVAAKYIKRSDLIEFNKNDILLGWIKIFGVKGFVLIGVMVFMGRFLRHSNIDRPILGIVYLAVGISLLYASRIFFSTCKAK